MTALRRVGERRAARTVKSALVPGAAMALAAFLATIGCASGGGAPAPQSRAPSVSAAYASGPRDDRLVFGDFAVVTAVAVSHRFVFAATNGALLVFDRLTERWRPPVTRTDGFPGEVVTALVADASADAAWLGTRTRWLRVEFVETMPLVTPAMPGIEVRGARSATLDDLYQRYPALREFASLLTRDAQLRSHPAIAGAQSPERSEVWLGTAGGGLFQVDPIFGEVTPRPFGTLGAVAGALASGPDGVWIAGFDGARGAAGLTFASESLERIRWVGGSRSVSLDGMRSRRLAVRDSTAWVAAVDGLYRVDVRDVVDVRRITALDGLPSDEVLSVLPWRGGVWAGTTRGLAFVNDSGGASSVREQAVNVEGLRGFGVSGLAASGDTLWLATTEGLVLRLPNGIFVRASVVFSDQRLNRDFAAVALSDSLAAALSSTGELLAIDRRSSRVLPLPLATLRPSTGVPMSLAMDERAVWVSGVDGVLVFLRMPRTTQLLRARTDLPGIPLDILLTSGAAWIGTTAGAVRFRRLPDGGTP